MIDIKEYAQKVAACRTAQSNFFKMRKKGTARPSDIQDALQYSKNLEKELDEITASILNPATTKQPGLF